MRGAKQKEMFEISDLRGRGILHLRSVCLFVPQERRGILIFSYIRRLGQFFFSVQNFEFQYFWGFHKTEYFWGMKILWILFWGHHKICPYLEVISMHFRAFSESQGTEWRIFVGLLKFQISV